MRQNKEVKDEKRKERKRKRVNFASHSHEQC